LVRVLALEVHRRLKPLISTALIAALETPRYQG
jgi:hypothetical protein